MVDQHLLLGNKEEGRQGSNWRQSENKGHRLFARKIGAEQDLWTEKRRIRKTKGKKRENKISLFEIKNLM